MGNNTLRIRDITVPQLPDEDCWTVKMRRAMQEALTEEDFADLAKSLMAKAKAGDKAALQVVLGQVLSPGPKTVTINQHFHQQRKGRKAARVERIGSNSTPGYMPKPQDISNRVAKLRAAKGLPAVEYDAGDEG